MTVELYENDNTTLVADVTQTTAGVQQAPVAASAQNVWNGDGTVSVSLTTDHPAWPEFTDGRIIRLTDPSGTALKAGVIEGLNEPRVSDSTVAEVTAGGLISEWEKAPIDPWVNNLRGSWSRVFNWASPGAPTGSWSTTVHHIARPAEIDWPPKAWPMPDMYGTWMWSRPITGTAHPAGDSYFLRDFTLAAATEIVIFVAADNGYEPWLDGTTLDDSPVKFPDRSGFEKTRRYHLAVDAGAHRVGFRVTNFTGGAVNPAGLLIGAFEVTSAGDLGPVIFTSAASMSWLCLDYPTGLPGYTAPQILTTLLAEVQANLHLPGWTIAAHGTFPQIEEFVCASGDSMRDVLAALAAEHVNFTESAAGKVLHLYPKTDPLTSSGVTFTQGVNLAELTEKVDYSHVYTAVQAKWAKGVRWRALPGTRRSKTLELGGITEPASVDRIADAWIAAHKDPSRKIVAEVIDTPGAMAGIDYTVGETVVLDGETVQDVAMTWTLADNGDFTVTPEFSTLLEVEVLERRRAVERMVKQFDAPVTAALIDSGVLIHSGVVETRMVSWSWSGVITEEMKELSQVERPGAKERLWAIEAEVPPEDLGLATGDTIIELHKNGALLNGLYNLTLKTNRPRHVVPIWGYETCDPNDRFNIVASTLGGHVNGRVSLYFAEPI